MMPRTHQKLLFEEPYGALLDGVLVFRTLSDTEATLLRLEQLRLLFLQSDDKKGVEYCKQVALAGRMRAEAVGRNPRVAEAKRRAKAESALWFRIWLEIPGSFATWLALRKATGTYRALCEGESLPSPPE